jgi:hypothetical protein
VNIITLQTSYSQEPTAADLAAIELEWPLIEADLDLLNAHIAFYNAGSSPSELDWRRVRRAEHQVLTVTRDLANRDLGTEVVA